MGCSLIYMEATEAHKLIAAIIAADEAEDMDAIVAMMARTNRKPRRYLWGLITVE